MILTTKPIPLDVVDRIKTLLSDKPRELSWFVLSMNLGLRGGDVLSILISDIQGDELILREKKSGKIRTLRINPSTRAILDRWLEVHPGRTEYLFEGTKGKMNTSYWTVLLKEWCKAVGYEEPRTATHSLRKTFVKTHYERGTNLATLMTILNHSTERQVLTYCGVMAEEVSAVYEDAI